MRVDRRLLAFSATARPRVGGARDEAVELQLVPALEREAAPRDDAMAVIGAGAPAGYMYATSGALPNFWKTVPDYFDAKADRLER